jgi:hypothetical protein
MKAQVPAREPIELADLVSPIQDLIAVLHPFWELYASLRQDGANQEGAISAALYTLLPTASCRVVIHMLEGDLDWRLSTTDISFDGRHMRDELVSTGDSYWQRTCVANGTGTEIDTLCS